jgi:hypothetical protein
VALACAFQDVTPRGASCTVTPSAVSLNGTDPAPFTVSVTTAAGAMISPIGDHKSPLQGPETGGHRPPLQGTGESRRPEGLRYMLLLMAGLVLLAAKGRRVTNQLRASEASLVRTPTPQAAVLAAILVSVFIWAACGGSGPRQPQTGTPAGNYTLTVTATAGGLTQSTILTLTVN